VRPYIFFKLTSVHSPVISNLANRLKRRLNDPDNWCHNMQASSLDNGNDINSSRNERHQFRSSQRDRRISHFRRSSLLAELPYHEENGQDSSSDDPQETSRFYENPWHIRCVGQQICRLRGGPSPCGMRLSNNKAKQARRRSAMIACTTRL